MPTKRARKTRTAAQLIKAYGYWGEYVDHPIKDWREMVANWGTRFGYWDWVADVLARKED